MRDTFLLRLNRSRRLSLLILLGIFLLLFFCNWETDMIADDFRYCFSFADESRIEHVADIFPSMAAHRHTMNGRVFAHFLVQLFLLLPKPVFKILNALCFTSLVWTAVRLARRDRVPDALLLLTVFGCLWILQPEFGQVFLWLDGSVNYLWSALLCLLWLFPWTDDFLSGRPLSRVGQILFILISFVVGAHMENASVAMIFMAMLFIGLRVFVRRQKIAPWMLLSLASAILGFFYLMLAPATAANKAAEMKFDVLLSNFVATGSYYLRFWPLLLSYVLFFFLALRDGIDRDRRVLSLVYLLGSLAGHFVLTFALYCTGRSTYIGLVLLIMANAVLFVPLFETPRRRLLAALCAVCLLVTVFRVFVGVRDIRVTHGKLRFNEELIEECVANGERDLQIPRPYSATKYSALSGLGYLTEDPTDWYNVYMAKYYGVDSIIGY